MKKSEKKTNSKFDSFKLVLSDKKKPKLFLFYLEYLLKEISI